MYTKENVFELMQIGSLADSTYDRVRYYERPIEVSSLSKQLQRDEKDEENA